jgi:hypothetical protein
MIGTPVIATQKMLLPLNRLADAAFEGLCSWVPNPAATNLGKHVGLYTISGKRLFSKKLFVVGKAIETVTNPETRET